MDSRIFKNIVIFLFKLIIAYPIIIPVLWVFCHLIYYQIKIIGKIPPFFGYHFYKKIVILPYPFFGHDLLSCFCCLDKKLKLWYYNRTIHIKKGDVLSKKQKRQYDNALNVKEYISDLPYIFIFLFKYSLLLAIIRDHIYIFFRYKFELYGVSLYYRLFTIFYRLKIFRSHGSMNQKNMRKYYKYDIYSR